MEDGKWIEAERSRTGFRDMGCMKDGEWKRIGDDVESCIRHFSMAVETYRNMESGMDGSEEYVFSMALMHMVMAGHTSFGNAVRRILAMFGERAPAGESLLIDRVSGPEGERPPVIGARLAAAAHGTLGFRNVAAESYDRFSLDCCERAIEACEYMVLHFPQAVKDFRTRVDPVPQEDRESGSPQP